MCFRPAQVAKPIKCPVCGALNPFNVLTCKKCKADLGNSIMMVKCPKCGRMSLLNSGICDDCGLDFDVIQTMIDSGDAKREDVIVRADGSMVDWDQVPTDFKISGSAATNTPDAPVAPVAPVAPTMPTAPGVFAAPAAPSAPVAPTAPSGSVV